VTVAAFGITGLIDACAAFDRRIHLLDSMSISPVVLDKERVVDCVDVVYILVSLVSFANATVHKEGASFRRLMLFGIALFATHTVTLVSRFWFLWLNAYSASVLPQVLSTSVHVSVSSALLLLLRSEGTPVYKKIEGHEISEILEVSSSPNDADEFPDGFDEQLM
jgi:hypothetical protein